MISQLNCLNFAVLMSLLLFFCVFIYPDKTILPVLFCSGVSARTSVSMSGRMEYYFSNKTQISVVKEINLLRNLSGKVPFSILQRLMLSGNFGLSTQEHGNFPAHMRDRDFRVCSTRVDLSCIKKSYLKRLLINRSWK